MSDRKVTMDDVRDISPDEMEKYVVRYGEQTSVRSHTVEVLKLPVPDWVFGKLFARDLVNLVGKTTNPMNVFPTEGPPQTSILIARMPPKMGPIYLHVHKQTWETFFILAGSFRVNYGEDGKYSCVLNKYDTIAIPPMVIRNFENISEEMGEILVVVAGAELEKELVFPKSVTQDIEKNGGAPIRGMLEAAGLEFMD